MLRLPTVELNTNLRSSRSRMVESSTILSMVKLDWHMAFPITWNHLWIIVWSLGLQSRQKVDWSVFLKELYTSTTHPSSKMNKSMLTITVLWCYLVKFRFLTRTSREEEVLQCSAAFTTKIWKRLTELFWQCMVFLKLRYKTLSLSMLEVQMEVVSAFLGKFPQRSKKVLLSSVQGC